MLAAELQVPVVMIPPAPRLPRVLQRPWPWVLLALACAFPPAAVAEDDPHGLWAPADGGPITVAVGAKIPEDGAACVDVAVKNARFDIAVIADSLTGGPGMQLTRYKEAFARCMVDKGWRRVDAAELTAKRIQGQLVDCHAGAAALCASAVSEYVHGVAGAELDAGVAIQAGRKLCEAGDGPTCLTMASILLRPPADRGVATDPKLALQLARVGCDRGHAESCAFAGVLLATGAGNEPKDVLKGRKLLEKACADGVPSACDWPNSPPPEPVDTSLPEAARWCQYGSGVVRGAAECGSAPVAWVARPLDRPCEPRVSLDIGYCHYEYQLGH